MTLDDNLPDPKTVIPPMSGDMYGDLSPGPTAVIMRLHLEQWANGPESALTRSELSHYTGLSLSAVKRAVRTLDQKQLIDIQRRTPVEEEIILTLPSKTDED